MARRAEDVLERALDAVRAHPHAPGPVFRAGLRGVLGTMRALQAAGRAADERLHPQWREAPVQAPLWIMACPRSGTTFLHRLMCLDEERFTALPTSQTLLPAVSWTRAIAGLQRADRALGQPIARVVRGAESRLFGDYDDIHRVAFGEPEEDEAFFLSEGVSPAWLMFLPWTEGMDELVWADRLPAVQRDALQARYRAFLQRQVHADGRGRTLLLKNALTAGRLSVVAGAAPDARWIQLVRDPYRSVPSLVSMFYAVLSTFYPAIEEDGPEVRALVRMGCDFYLAYHRHFEELPEARAITVRYADLIREPRAAIERIYGHFGMEITPAFAAALDASLRAQRSYTSRHEYSLERFGLVPSDIHGPLQEVFDTWGFERRADP